MDSTGSNSSSSTLSGFTTVDESDEQLFTHSKRQKLAGHLPQERSRTRRGKFKKGWNLAFIEASTRGGNFAYCRLCCRDFSVSHGGHNDAKCHREASGN